jgi:hypothetical protein
MVEIAGDEHYEFIPQILYVYNEESPYNDHKNGSSGGGLNAQFKVASKVRNSKKYNKL